MNKKTKKEKNVENHKRRTRDMVLYVRLSLRKEQLSRELINVDHDVKYLQHILCDDDLIIADALINSGISLDEFLSRFDDLDKKDYVCPFGGVE